MDELILTATDRQARALREDENLALRSAGRAVWEAPAVRSLRQWLGDIWAETWPSAQLLDSTQTLALWLRAVERDRRGVVGALACARGAREAQRIATLWRLPLARLQVQGEDHAAWCDWRDSVVAELRRNDWITAEDLPALVVEGLRSGQIPIPRGLRLQGFDPRLLDPSERLLIETLVARGAVPVPAAEPRSPVVRAWRCEDAASQFQRIAERLRLTLAPYAEGERTPPRILLVLPDPDARRVELEAALAEYLAPWLRPPAAQRQTPWRWARAAPLTARPWVEAALALIGMDARDNEGAAVSRLLLTPLLWPGLREEAALLDARLRDPGLPRYALSLLEARSGGTLRARLQALREGIEAMPRRAPPSRWAAHFRARLDALGWPGSTELSSEAYQELRELDRELEQLGALDLQTGSIDVTRARLWLGERLKRRFEPRAEHVQPILIGTLEDALGLPCDLLVVADASASAVPGPAAANPFLPIEAQRAAGLPQSAPALWLAWRRAQAAGLLGGAREALLLAPAVDERGGEQLPSALFAAHWTPAPPPVLRSSLQALAAAGPLGRVPDSDPVPAVAASEQARGDAQLFKLFQEAPFFAFCTHRLGVRALPRHPRGIAASVQGQLLHAALESIWRGLGDSAGLQALDTAARAALVDARLQPLLARALPAADYGRQLVRAEAVRLAELLMQWLGHEARRSDPFRVLAQELPLQLDFAGLPLSLRLDRADRVDTPEGPRILILDYKTGRAADPRGWREDALSEPQLPLYAVLLPQAGLPELPRVDGIAFGHLKDGHPTLSPRTRWALKLIDAPTPRADPGWEDWLAACRARLEAAALGFLAGQAGLSAAARRGARRDLLLLASDPGDADANEDAVGEDA